MASRTVLVTGATGLLGRAVAEEFRLRGWKVKGTGYSRADGVNILRVDLQNEQDVTEMLNEVKPQVIVHCAAEKYPDRVSKDPEGARSLNAVASKRLARLAAERDVFFLYISTDYVFSGAPGEAPYGADDAPKPGNLYGQTKLDGERAVLEAYAAAGKRGTGIALRVPVLYGHAEKRSESAVNVLMDTVMEAQRTGAKVRVDDWSVRYPTNTEDVGRVCRDIADKYLEAADRTSLPVVLQFSSEDKATKYTICQRFVEMMGVPGENMEAAKEGKDAQATTQRPFDCHLSTRGLKDLGIDVSTIDFTAWWRREIGAFRK